MRHPVLPARKGPNHPWFEDGKPRDVLYIGPEISDEIRRGLGWALFRPEGVTIRREPGRLYRVHKDDRGDVSPDIPDNVISGLLHLGMIVPSPDDPNVAIGNPEFLASNPLWRSYIPDPLRRVVSRPKA